MVKQSLFPKRGIFHVTTAKDASSRSYECVMFAESIIWVTALA